MSKDKVQTFRASSPREALDLVKQAFGPHAVILGTRSVPSPGVGLRIGRDWVEITAAPGDLPTLAPRATRVPVAPPPAAADKPALPKHLYPYYVQLVQNEVAAELASRLLRQAAESVPDGQNTNAAVLRDLVCRYIAQMMPKSDSVDVNPGDVRRVALVGPSGSGKTTTLAKLAARFKLEEKQRVALLSLDMQHLGAHEQLRRYAEILDVPFHTAQTIGEVRNCQRHLDSVDLLLIDTPGIGPREQGRFARLAVLLRAARPTETHVVLPASTSLDVLTRVAQSFAPFEPASVVLTRLDEVIGFGVVLNVVDRLHMTVTYFTTGQNVPHDLEKACGHRIAELLFEPNRMLSGSCVGQS